MTRPEVPRLVRDVAVQVKEATEANELNVLF